MQLFDFGFLLNIPFIVAFIAIVAVCFVPLKFKANFGALVISLNALLLSLMVLPALQGDIIKYSINAGTFLGTIPICIDGLSAWFILIVNFTFFTGAIYGVGYLKAYSEAKNKITFHWILFILFHLSMVWVCLLQHAFAFLIAWEIMSLSSMLLVIFDNQNPKTIKAGINYFVQMHISVVLLTVGFIWVYFQTGSFSFEAIGLFFNTNPNIWLFLIFFIGFGIKAGFVPLHTWLPYAHPAAPSHVSGVMSGVIVKMGIYGIFRIITFLKADYLILGEMIVTISIITGLYGILNASVRRDYKQMLAYCTIENIGIIGVGIGLGLIGIGTQSPLLYYLGFGGSLLHVLNHSLFKSLLFYSAGSVYQQTHTRNMDKLGGLIKYMPKTAILFLIGAIAIGGIPPFNGFISEFIIYSGIIEGLKTNNISEILLLVLTLAGISVIGGVSILTFTKTYGTIFLGSEREKLSHKPTEVSRTMLFPQYLIVIVMLSVVFFPQFYLNTVNNISLSLNNSLFAANITGLENYSQTLKYISLFSALFIAIVALFWTIRWFAIKNKPHDIQPTWGCGYMAAYSKMQYTSKSFAKPLSKIFSFLLIEKKQYHEIQNSEIFPKKRKYLSKYFDFFEFRLINSILHRIIYFTNYFKFIQNGRMQSYVLYGIIFIIAIFILTVFNLI